MAITYNISKCKGGYGVYVNSLSGYELKALRPYLKGVKLKGSYSLKRGELKLDAIAVYSGRITRKDSKELAHKAIDHIKCKSLDLQCTRISRLYLKQKDKVNEVVNLSYFVLSRDFKGQQIKHFTTQNKLQAEKIAFFYGERNVPAKLTKTISRHIKGSKDEIKVIKERGEVKYNYLSNGSPGFNNGSKELHKETLQAIQRNKKPVRRLVSVTEWNARLENINNQK